MRLALLALALILITACSQAPECPPPVTDRICEFDDRFVCDDWRLQWDPVLEEGHVYLNVTNVGSAVTLESIAVDHCVLERSEVWRANETKAFDILCRFNTQCTDQGPFANRYGWDYFTLEIRYENVIKGRLHTFIPFVR